MHRTVITTNYGASEQKHTVRLTAEPSEGAGVAGFAAMFALLATVRDTPDLIRHASDCPLDVRLFHDDGSWVLEAVSIARRPD